MEGMPRRLRIQYPDAFYRLMGGGNGRQDIVHDDVDRDRIPESPCEWASASRTARPWSIASTRASRTSPSRRSRLENGKVTFDSQKIMAHFEGQLDEKAGEIAGTWKQPGGSFPLSWKRKEAELKVGAAAPKELEGRWTGTLKVNVQVSFRLALHVEKPKTGDGWTALIDSLDQGVDGIPVTRPSG